jgi:hypothetical protein
MQEEVRRALWAAQANEEYNAKRLDDARERIGQLESGLAELQTVVMRLESYIAEREGEMWKIWLEEQERDEPGAANGTDASGPLHDAAGGQDGE